MVALGPPREKEDEWEGLEEIEFWPEEGQGICGEEARASVARKVGQHLWREWWAKTTLDCIFPLSLSFVSFFFCLLSSAVLRRKEMGTPH